MNMKRKITKLLATALLAVVLVCSAVFATGCYVIRGVKMKDLKGTYELTHYSARTNLLEEREIKLYLVINNSGDCYYVFKDNDTELYASEMRVSFTANQEDSSKYDYVKCTFYDNYTIDFGINGDILNYSKIVWKPLEWGKPLETDYTISVSFKKVSKKTDLSYVANKMDAELTAMPFGWAQKSSVYTLENISMDGWFLSREEIAEIGMEQPVYAYVRLDTFNNKATCYYMMASEEEQKEIEFTFTFVVQGVGEFHLRDSKGGVWIVSGNQLRYVVPNVGTEGNQTMQWNFGVSGYMDYDLTETIAMRVSAYESNKCNYKGHTWAMDDAVDLCEYAKTCTECEAKEGKNVAHIYDDDNDAYCNTCGDERQLLIVPPELNPDDTDSSTDSSTNSELDGETNSENSAE